MEQLFAAWFVISVFLVHKPAQCLLGLLPGSHCSKEKLDDAPGSSLKTLPMQ
jgi:hypothetical protein